MRLNKTLSELEKLKSPLYSCDDEGIHRTADLSGNNCQTPSMTTQLQIMKHRGKRETREYKPDIHEEIYWNPSNNMCWIFRFPMSKPTKNNTNFFLGGTINFTCITQNATNEKKKTGRSKSMHQKNEAVIKTMPLAGTAAMMPISSKGISAGQLLIDTESEAIR